LELEADFLRGSSCERQQGDIARLLDRRGKAMLVRRANAGQAPGHDFTALGYKLAEQTVVFVVDVGNLLGAELADFLAPEKFACSALSRWAAGA
jgi:hypothetical protein